MPPKKDQPRDQHGRQPDKKGKKPAKPPSHHDQGGAAGSAPGPSGSGHRTPAPKKKKKKKYVDDDAGRGSCCEFSSDDSVFRDMTGGNPNNKLARQYLALPSITTTVNVEESTSTDVAGPPTHIAGPPANVAGPSTMDVSPAPSPVSIARDDISSNASSLLRAPLRDDHSSSASSRGSKRRREASPHSQRQPSRTSTRSRRASPPRQSGMLEHENAMLRQQVAMLQRQVQHHQAEVNAMGQQLRREYDAGVTHGQARGFEEAMDMTMQSTPSRAEPRGRRDHHDDDEREAEALRQASRMSLRDTQPARPAQTPGAGPSREARRPASRPAPDHTSAATRTSAPRVTVPTPSSDVRSYDVAVITTRTFTVPDPERTKWPGFACIPLPRGWRSYTPGIVTISGPAAPPNPEDATSYLDLWAGFANGRTVPDPFRRLFQAIGIEFHPDDARTALMGYRLVRRITRTMAGTLNRDAINAFLVTLAAFQRTVPIATGRTGLWATILEHDTSSPQNNWAQLVAFMNPETYPREDFGLTWRPPADTSQPWEIHTLWRQDAFMQVLLAIRPSLSALRELLAYADTFIRTRPAAQPLPGVTLPNEPQDRMYTASFTLGPATPDAFLVDTMSTPAVPPADMEVDDLPPSQPLDPNVPPA